MLKKKLRRLSAMLMAGVMAVSMFGTAFADETPTDPIPDPSVSAEGYESEDVYVMNYANTPIKGYEEWSKKRFYFSPYRSDIYVDENGDGDTNDYGENWNWCTASVLNMINTTKISQGGEGAYASIPVYCVDAVTGGVPGTSYRRVNLEDSTYFSEETAGRIRAIIMNAFPFKAESELGSIAAAANDAGFSVADLNKYEVITAAQAAIWTIANNGKLDSSAYAGYEGYASCSKCNQGIAHSDFDDYCEAWYADQCIYNDIEATDADGNMLYPTNGSDIDALAEYYVSLAPMPAEETVISNASFTNYAVDFVRQADSTYTANVIATVDVDEDTIFDLTLTAIVGEKMQQKDLTADGTYEFTFTGLASEELTTLAIDGSQSAGDVFLFDPVGGRDISQTMAGYDESELPVHGIVTIEPDRKLVIHKYTPATPSGDAADGTQVEISDTVYKPLANVQFTIYKVCTMDEYLNGEYKLSKVPSADEIALYKTNANKVITLTTDANGYAAHNFGKDNDAIYMIVEEPSAAVTKPVDPFYLAVPMTNPTGDGWLYEINVYPKNDTEGEPTINKDVTKLDNNKDTFDFGEVYDYIIRTSIPADMAKATQYTITDELDSRLNYLGNVSVKVFNGEEIALDAATDYTASFEDNTLTVALTPAGCAAVAGKVSDSLLVTPEVRVYFQASIKSDAGNMGVEIPNDATLDYTNSIGLTFKVESDEVVVYTGGFNLLKVDGNDTTVALSGAHFTLYRPANVGETADTTLMINEASIPVIEVSDLVSNENGKASIEGIAYGNYYLVETKAPTGYNLLPDPVKVVVDKDSHEDSNAIQVLNFGGFELPSTGGIGTTVYTLMGSMTMAASGMYIFLKKREN